VCFESSDGKVCLWDSLEFDCIWETVACDGSSAAPYSKVTNAKKVTVSVLYWYEELPAV